MDKDKVKTFVNGAASKAATTANEKAKASTGWKRVLWAIAAVVAGAVAWFTTGCTPANVEQLQAAHAIYHAISGKPCKFSPEVARSVK